MWYATTEYKTEVFASLNRVLKHRNDLCGSWSVRKLSVNLLSVQKAIIIILSFLDSLLLYRAPFSEFYRNKISNYNLFPNDDKLKELFSK